MARVVAPDGQDLGDVTGAALAYYRREPGFVIDDVVAHPLPDSDDAETVPVDVEGDTVPEVTDVETVDEKPARRGIFGSSGESTEDA